MENYVSANVSPNAQALRGTVASTNFLGKVANFFSEALVSIRNYLPNCLTDLFHWSLSEESVKDIHLDFASRLTGVANPADAIHIPHVASYQGDAMKRSNLLGFLTKAREIVQGKASKLGSAIEFLNRKHSDELSAGEFAFVSYALEAVLNDLGSPQNIEQLCGESPQHKFAVDVINILKDKVGKSMQRLAKDSIIDALDAKYHERLGKVGYSQIFTLDGSLGVKTGSPINIEGVVDIGAQASVDGAVMVQWSLDDEGYIAIVKTKSLGGTAGVTADFGLVKASAQLKGNRQTGDYKEVKTSREFVTYLLPEFIRDSEHRADPNIAPYLSRSSLLAHELASEGIAQDFALWAVTREEVIDGNLFAEESQLELEHHDMLLSLFISSTPLDVDSDTQSKKVLLAQKRSWIAEFERDIADYASRPYSIENEEVIGKLKNLVIKEKQGIVDLDSSIDLGALSVDQSIKPIQSQAIQVSNVIPAQAELFAYTGRAQAEAKVGLDVLGIENMFSAGIAGSYTKKYRTLNDIKRTSLCSFFAGKKSDEEKNTVRQQLSRQFATFEDSLFEHWVKDTAASDNPLFFYGLHVSTKFGDREKELFALLKNDFTFYTNLRHRMDIQKFVTPQDQKTLRDFEERYNFTTAEQFVHRMVVANAHLFSSTVDEDLHAEMLQFEKTVLSPSFKVDNAYLKERAYYQENMDFEANEDIYSGEINFTVVLDACTFKFEYVDRVRTHTNQLRDGSYKDVKFSINGAVTNVTALMKAAAHSITLAKGMSPELATKVLGDMASVLSSVEVTGTCDVQKDYLLRYFKPNAFGGAIPEKLLFYRELQETSRQLGLKGSIPTGLPLNLAFGLGYSDLLIESLLEEFSADTFIYAWMLGMHQYAITPEDKSTFDIAENATWQQIKSRQQKFFRQSFARYANELATDNLGVNSLSHELNAIENEIFFNAHLAPAQKEAFSLAKIAFQNAVRRADTTLEDKIVCFEKLMHAYSVNWLDMRAYSTYYKGGYLPELEIPRDVTAMRLQEARINRGLLVK